jgi:glycosyltransferase involved in cell wall biosynthesis
MRILCLAPVMAKSFCDDYYMYKQIRDKGAEITFITGQSAGDRLGGMKLPLYENKDGFPIYRLYKDSREMLIFPRRRLKEILQIANGLKPDLILCHLHSNMPIALKLRKYLGGIPIVLHVESARAIRQRKFVAGWKMSIAYRLHEMPLNGFSLWAWLCEKADVIITSDPKEERKLSSSECKGKPVYYVPWPASVPNGCEVSSTRYKQRAIYAGNLIPFKNTQVFQWLLPLILQKTPTKEFIIVGTGSHKTIVLSLKQQFGDAIKYIPRLTRWQIIKLISSSYYAFTPVKEGGLGFIGDCWGVGTPLLMLHSVFESKSLDMCVAESSEDLINKINRLYEDPEFYRQLRDTGCKAYEKRSYEAVGDELFGILSEVRVHA